MSTTPNKPSYDSQQDRSDVLSLLKSIDGMCDACQHVLNTYTQTTLMLAITTEAQMLYMKLQVMKERWNYHLPFKEASGVDFYDWSKRFEEVSHWMIGNDNPDQPVGDVPEYCPSKHFMLDLYSLLPENRPADGALPYYAETNTARLITVQERNRKLIAEEWNIYRPRFSELVVDSLDDPSIGPLLKPLAEKSRDISHGCSAVLLRLSKVLRELYEMPKGEIRKDQFIRLAERVVNEPEYGGAEAQKKAWREFNNIKNSTPEDDWPQCRDDETNATGELISEMKFGGKLLRFLSHNYIIKDHYAGLGRFLNTYRRDIDVHELTSIIEMLFYIHYLHEDLDRQEAAAIEEAQPAEAPAKAKDALSVYQNRKAIQPRRPALSVVFASGLVENPEAVVRYYEVLHHCGFYIGRTLLSKEKRNKEESRYEGWKWRHLREAFLNLGFLRSDHAKKRFAEYLAKVFPYLTADNVLRGFSSRGSYVDKEADNRIIADIEDEFRLVKAMMAASSSRS